MQLEVTGCLENLWLEVFRELGAPKAVLACTYTLSADFFEGLLERFTEAALECQTSEGDSFFRIPVEVVCDRTRYRGHKIGFNVLFWPNSVRLFHPKLLIVLFQNEVIWSDGSLNLTSHGWQSNRELAMFHRPGKLCLPKAIRELLAALPGASAAKLILDYTKNESTADLPGKCITSLNNTIGERFLADAPRYAEEVHIVAPFFETNESIETPLDEKWLGKLVTRYPDAIFHIYLPQLEFNPLRVQGSRTIFASVERRLTNRLVLHAVAPSPGPLHGKFIGIVYYSMRIQRVYMLVGSPNMTHAALLAPPTRGNIELAWFIDKRWSDVRKFLHAMGAKGQSIDDADFKLPIINRVDTWMPLSCASYDPLKRIIRLKWKDIKDSRCTVIRYCGRRISLSKVTEVKPFDLVDGISYLLTHMKGGDTKTGLCPIEIPFEDLPACNADTIERTPDEWLWLLGAITEERTTTNPIRNQRVRKDESTITGGFEWSTRVRDLAARMRFSESSLRDPDLKPVENKWLCNLIDQIFCAHESADIENKLEQVWRVWVRLELWQLAVRLSAHGPSLQKRRFWSARARKMRRNIGLRMIPQAIQKQYRAAMKALENGR